MIWCCRITSHHSLQEIWCLSHAWKKVRCDDRCDQPVFWHYHLELYEPSFDSECRRCCWLQVSVKFRLSLINCMLCDTFKVVSKHMVSSEHKMGGFQLQKCESGLATGSCPIQAFFRRIFGSKLKLYRMDHVSWFILKPIFLLNLVLKYNEAWKNCLITSFLPQDRSTTLNRVQASLSQQIGVLKSMAISISISCKIQEVQQEVELNIFKTVAI